MKQLYIGVFKIKEIYIFNPKISMNDYKKKTPKIFLYSKSSGRFTDYFFLSLFLRFFLLFCEVNFLISTWNVLKLKKGDILKEKQIPLFCFLFQFLKLK